MEATNETQRCAALNSAGGGGRAPEEVPTSHVMIRKSDKLESQGSSTCSERYCGWTNKETWRVMNWLSADEAIHLAVVELAEDCAEENLPFEPALKEFVEALVDIEARLSGINACLLWDLATDALLRVDWKAIAKSYEVI